MGTKRLARIGLAIGLVLPALALAAFLGGCGKDKGSGGQTVARIGSKAITEADMQSRLQEMPPFMKQQLSTPDGRKRLLDALVEEELVYRDATAMGLDKSEEYSKELERTRRDLLIRAYYDKVVEAKAVPSDAEVEQYYNSNKSEFMVPEGVTARHILVKTKEEAAQLRKGLDKGADFAQEAGKYSLDASSKSSGGLIGGPIQRGANVKGLGAMPELVAAAFELEEGQMSQPIKTSKGYDILRVEKRTPETTKSLEEARNDIVSKLTYSKRKTVRDETINSLKSKYKVVYMTESEQASAAPATPEELFRMAGETADGKDKIKYYRQFIQKYPTDERAYEAKFMIGFTQAEELKDYDAAEKEFKDFLAQYPNTDLSDDAKWMVDNMRSGKHPDLK